MSVMFMYLLQLGLEFCENVDKNVTETVLKYTENGIYPSLSHLPPYVHPVPMYHWKGWNISQSVPFTTDTYTILILMSILSWCTAGEREWDISQSVPFITRMYVSLCPSHPIVYCSPKEWDISQSVLVLFTVYTCTCTMYTV